MSMFKTKKSRAALVGVGEGSGTPHLLSLPQNHGRKSQDLMTSKRLVALKFNGAPKRVRTGRSKGSAISWKIVDN